jgi:hypothetical protein
MSDVDELFDDDAGELKQTPPPQQEQTLEDDLEDDMGDVQPATPAAAAGGWLGVSVPPQRSRPPP